MVDALRAEFRRAGITQRDQITPARVRGYLKKLRLTTKYGEHVHMLCDKMLCGVQAPMVRPELEARLKAMFLEVQAPFERHCPADRVNFLNYKYTLFKMCELLGEDKLARHFPLLKDPEKLHAQDRIWKKMCADLRWEFIPSI